MAVSTLVCLDCFRFERKSKIRENDSERDTVKWRIFFVILDIETLNDVINLYSLFHIRNGTANLKNHWSVDYFLSI